MKKLRAAEEKQKQKEEEAKLEKRIQEQQERMKKEYDEEVAKKRAKEEAVSMGVGTIINHWKWSNQGDCYHVITHIITMFLVYRN